MAANVSDANSKVMLNKNDISAMTLNEIEASVNHLYHFRDHFFETHDIKEESMNRNKLVEQELKKTITLIHKYKDQCEKENRARFHYLWGRALNVTSEFNPEALETLKKSVKFDYKFTEAWNELGECLWRKGDMDDARNCFEGALRRGPNKVSLRSLSMVLRQLGNTKDEKQKKVLDSVTKAKEAVNLDIEDGTSWRNAYLTAFFTLGQDPKLLKQSMAAYRQAALKYEEEYQEALEGFAQAQLLDYSWPAPKSKERDLLQYLQKVQSLTQNKGQLKPKRLQNFTRSLSNPSKDLGPYVGGKYVSSGGQSIVLENVALSSLQAGINAEKVVLGKVVCQVSSEDPIPFHRNSAYVRVPDSVWGGLTKFQVVFCPYNTFCIVDQFMECYSVTVYNLAQGQGVIIGDSVAIPEPFVQLVDVNHNGTVVSYRNIRVDSPMVLVVNGKKFGLDKHAPSEIGFTTSQ